MTADCTCWLRTSQNKATLASPLALPTMLIVYVSATIMAGRINLILISVVISGTREWRQTRERAAEWIW